MSKRFNGKGQGTQSIEPIAYKLAHAAIAVDLSVPYLKNAIRDGKLKATRLTQPGRGRSVILVTKEELLRFVTADNAADGLAVAQ